MKTDNKLYIPRIKDNIFISDILIPCLLMSLVFISVNLLFYNKYLLMLLDRYRPEYRPRPLNVHIQKQILHLQYLTMESEIKNRVIFIGSSSVVNGIDVNIIKQILHKNNLDLYPINYGLTGLNAYELPLLKNYIITDKIKVIVYLYNTFSFSDNIYDQAVIDRYNTSEFINTVGLKYILKNLDQFSISMQCEIFPAMRYNQLILDYIRRFFTRQLKPYPNYDYDYPPNRPPPPIRRLHVKDIPILKGVDWLRDAYITSSTDKDTIGYRGLRRFIDMANAQGIKVIVAPIPEPDFADFDQYKYGININRIDEHVRNIVKADDSKIFYLDRDNIRYIESQDRYFSDGVHMFDTGREEYSKYIANRLIDIIK